jgi:hypothetical protein
MARATKATAKKAARKPAKRAAKAAAKKAAKRPATRPRKAAAKRAPSTPTPTFVATGRARGRPPGITDSSVHDPAVPVGVAIPNLIGAGYDPREASILAGIFPDTLTTWLNHGAEAWARLQVDPTAVLADDDAPYVALFEECAMAEASNVAELFAVARRYAERDARWHGNYLTMRHRDRFGARRVEVTGAGGGPVRGSVEVWSLERLEAAVAVAEAHGNERGAIDATSRELTA